MDLVLLVVALVFLIIGYWLGSKIGRIIADKGWEDKIPEIRKDAIKRSRAVLGGKFSENLAPFLPDFPYKPTECRFVGKPIDFLVFEGMDDKKIQKIAFVEVKSGKSRLSKQERFLRDAIKDKQVEWREYRIPEGLTKE